MSIKQLQQLESVNLSNIVSVDTSVNPNKNVLVDGGSVLSNYLFETSKFIEYENEANSYYKSFKMDGLQLSAMFLTDLWNKINFLSAESEKLTPYPT